MYENFFLKIPFVTQGLIDNVVGVLLSVGPIFLLLILINICWKTWLGYKRFEFITKQNRILLELRLPKEIKKTPLAMELLLNAIHQTGGEGTWYARDFQGKARTWFSLEIVSIGGQVKFFIWTEKFYKNFLESQIYAQYPGVEIYEVPDYTKSVQLDFNKVSAWGSEFILTKADPYPIKTYIDYKLDKEGIKDEEKSDPMSPVIELLGSIEKGEQIWIQILVRAHKKEYKKSLSFEDKIKKMKWSDKVDWTDAGKKEILKLAEKSKSEKGESARMATKGEQNIIASLERNIDKMAFDCGIRTMYIAEKEKFNAINVVGTVGSFKQYNSMSLNGFRPNHVTAFDFPWQDYKDIRASKLKKHMLGLYKRRAYFYFPYRNSNQFVLSSEELATIFHLPGEVVQTPTFSRVASKKSEPPVDLPF
ncbi:hypothetical protein A2442_03355 [Candidatus Campbellbacteria bacterium RIFOXYC2_FULL_35_25]|uniref:DUF8128 domain-containing protein n=1 Tax=Candidatus Campbellbacteria bacterium RIFOXYC2_FULL_35_25 TaxID=1797582 RepID=A0A1F5EI59_9BACT|nr:MAG: hypothetical protein A2442_03355 [Candidatus Campbellbacteria bacterium RIFOXYC2_FULL_35_25]